VRRSTIAVCGSSRSDGALAVLGERLGAAICDGGFNLVCGGLGGVMEAAALGYASARGNGPGVVVGIVPGSDARAASVYCDVVVPTGMGFARNVLVVLAGDGVVLCGGGSGTLSEAALAWQHGRPVCALRPSGGWAEALAGRSLDDRRIDRVEGFDDPAAAVAFLRGAILGR
jgi:uncharacterized protein (TIGR00725 family)